jgi:hypothetical protein
VATLAALLGLARAVRRRVPSPVLEFAADVKKGALRLQLQSRADLSAETYDLERHQRRLESTLKLALDVTAKGASQ